MSGDETRHFNGEDPTVEDPIGRVDPILVRGHDQIGPYRILAKIGEGGFGVVYEAQQEEPVKRRVALKVIKPGMDSERVIARFEAERQALAVMNHPNIAKVLDGGLTDRGLPYFVMELVKGEPINRFCDRHMLSLDERLRLFIPVCQAIQHAHSKSVIHRDIKPSNILVGYDSEGHASPTVIDFGVAKALNQRLTEQTIYTDQGQMIGTPEYMSPEQAEMSALDIDTRTDIYSLGVVLYELLTGMLPFSPEELRGKMYAEMQRIIREQTPPKPSTRLSASKEAANKRHTSPYELTKSLRGELDWVVMKCLEKDRDRRYATPIALAEEITHYLRNEPIAARPPSAAYRVSKFVRRHRAPLAALAVVIVSLIATTLLATVFGVRESRARQVAELERQSSDAVVDFLANDLLVQASPDSSGRDARVIDLLDSASDRLSDRQGGDSPMSARAEGVVRRAIGSAYLRLGQADTAAVHLDGALNRHTGPGDGEARWDILLKLAEARYRLGEYEEAMELASEVTGNAGADPAPTRAGADAWAIQASCHKRLNNLDEAHDLYMKALGAYSAVLGEDCIDAWRTKYNMALLAELRGKRQEAIGQLRQVLDAYTRKGDRESMISALNARGELALLYVRDGDDDRAEPLYRQTLEEADQMLGPEGYRTLLTRVHLARLLERTDRLEGALRLYREAIDACDLRQGPGGEETLQVVSFYIKALRNSGRDEEAGHWLSSRLALLDTMKSQQGAGEPDVAMAIERTRALLSSVQTNSQP